jgi:anti-sigma-K factor RskA
MGDVSEITCDEADELLAARALGDPLARADKALSHHLRRCAGCRANEVIHEQTAAQLATALAPATPSRDLRARLMADVYREVTLPAQRASRWAALWRRIPAGPGFSLAGMAAGVAVVAIVGINMATHRPAVLHATAAGQAVQPQARANLSIDTSSHMAIVDAQLTPSTGQVYQMWLVSPDHTVLASSYVTQQPDGRFTSAMAMAADPPDGSHVWVTLEPHTGDTKPLGPEVINMAVPAG